MKSYQFLVIALASAGLVAPAQGQAAFEASTITQAADDVIAWTTSVIYDSANWIPEGSDDFLFRRSNESTGWVQGAYLVGMKDWATFSGNEDHWEWMLGFAQEQDFALGPREYHADDHVVSQYYIALATHFDLPEAIEPVTETFDVIVANPSTVDLNYEETESSDDLSLDYGRACQHRWCWADAIFMGPPCFVALSEATDDPKYLEFAHPEFLALADLLFYEFDDMPGGLFFRDSEFLPEEDNLDADGNLIFWSRGNGWVFAALPAILRSMPEDFSGRDRYIEIFTLMAQAIKELQVTEGDYVGFWGPSLLAFDLFPTPESSGTAFFVGGFARGIAEGILPAADYLDVVSSGWSALLTAQADDGSIGWTQQIGSEPEDVTEDGVQLYSAGGFLQAAAGVQHLVEMGLLGDGADTTTATTLPSADTSAPTPASDDDETAVEATFEEEEDEELPRGPARRSSKGRRRPAH